MNTLIERSPPAQGLLLEGYIQDIIQALNTENEQQALHCLTLWSSFLEKAFSDMEPFMLFYVEPSVSSRKYTLTGEGAILLRVIQELQKRLEISLHLTTQLFSTKESTLFTLEVDFLKLINKGINTFLASLESLASTGDLFIVSSVNNSQDIDSAIKMKQRRLEPFFKLSVEYAMISKSILDIDDYVKSCPDKKEQAAGIKLVKSLKTFQLMLAKDPIKHFPLFAKKAAIAVEKFEYKAFPHWKRLLNGFLKILVEGGIHYGVGKHLSDININPKTLSFFDEEKRNSALQSMKCVIYKNIRKTSSQLNK